MPYQNIEATLSDADLKEIKTAISTIEAKMPFLVNLTTEERRSLFKMGDKRLAFVQNSLKAAQNNRGILPNSFDYDGYVKDCDLASQLTEVLMALRQITEQTDDTLMAVGSEAVSSSLTVYEYVKTAAKKTAGLKSVADQLGNLFKAIKGRSSKPSEPVK
jgi:hypothetical protein